MDDIESALAPRQPTTEEFSSDLNRLVSDLTRFAPGSLNLDTKEGRTESVVRYEQLAGLISLARARADAIHQGWARFLVGRQTDRMSVALPDGRRVPVSYKEPRADWIVRDAQGLHRELKELVDEDEITEEELELAVVPVISYQVNHTKLNVLHARSANAAAIIDQHRSRAEVNPLAGRVTFPRG